MMDLKTYKDSLARDEPPTGLSPALEALWWDAKGDWDKAHEHAQADDGAEGAWVHAYLHRKEGDLANAGYWYREAGRSRAEGDLEAEWAAIVAALLAAKRD
jgi:hypothetical protein